MKFCVVKLLILVFYLHSIDSFSYDGYKVYRVTPSTLDQAKLISEFEDDDNFDFWSGLRALDVPVDIMVSPAAQLRFEDILSSENIFYTVHIENVEEKIQAENQRQKRSTLTRGEVTFTEFMRNDDINAYLEQLAAEYPSIVTREIIGQSFEGRNLTLVRISSGGSNKPAIYIQAAIHAREWIAPPVALYIINQLVENAANSALYQDVDWIILPVVNPDGYEFTHLDTRLWRKTRTPGTICSGTDGNRNFGYYWRVAGASYWQCSETYAGHKEFSEVETQAVRDYLLANKENIKLFIDIHSYGNWLLYPWGFTTDPPEDAADLQAAGDRVRDAILAVRGTSYSVGNSNILLYATSGSGPDYAKGAAGIQLAYTLELPAGGNAGFNPEPEAIVPVVEETWEGIKEFHQKCLMSNRQVVPRWKLKVIQFCQEIRNRDARRPDEVSLDTARKLFTSVYM